MEADLNMTYLAILVLAFIVYQIAKPKQTKVEKMTAFDAYLMEHHKKSIEEANRIPTVVIPPAENETRRDDDKKNNTFIQDLYLGMIKSGNYVDNDGLRKEAMQSMHITELELDDMLNSYKLDNKNKK